MPTVAETIRKVNEFAELPNGWHFGEGVPLSEDMRSNAIRFLKLAEVMGIRRMNAFPGVGGEIEVTFYHNDSMLELTLELDGSITIAEDELNDQVYFRENASRRDALTKLAEFSQKIWDSSESFTANITIQNVTTSPAGHLIYEVENPFLWSSGSARLIRAEHFVSTLNHFTLLKQVNHPFTGAFQMTLFRPGVAFSRVEAPLGMTATTISMVGREDKYEKSSSH